MRFSKVDQSPKKRTNFIVGNNYQISHTFVFEIQYLYISFGKIHWYIKFNIVMYYNVLNTIILMYTCILNFICFVCK